MQAFISGSPVKLARRALSSGFCVSSKRTSSFRDVAAKKRSRQTPKVVVSQLHPGVLSSTVTLLADEDVTRRIFIGGIGIILSGIVGVFVVAWLIGDKLGVVSEAS